MSDRKYFSTEESFQARTEWRQGCLEWTASVSDRGYGWIWWDGRMHNAHRYAWFRAYGEIPEGAHIDHACHNPACVNIRHLRLATPAQNAANQKGTRAGTESGVRNVTRKGNKWTVRVMKEQVMHYFGSYENLEDAAEVARNARRKLFGEFEGRG